MAKWSNERPNRVFKGMTEIPVRVRTTNITLGTTPGDKKLLESYIVSKAPDAMSKAEELANTYVPVPGVDNIPDEEKEKMITVFPIGKFLRNVKDPKVFYDPIFGLYPPKGVETEEVFVPFIWDYQIRGSFKESIAFIQRAAKGAASDSTEEIAVKVPMDIPADGENAAADSDAPKKRGRKKKAAPKIKVEKFKCASIKAYKKVVDGGWFTMQRRIPLLIPNTYIDEKGDERNTYDEKGRLPTWTRPLRASTAQGERTCIATSQFVPIGTEYYFTACVLNPDHKEALLETLDFKEKVGMLQWRGGGHGTFIWTPADADGHPTDDEP